MPQIKNIEGLTAREINEELQQGAKFVVYQYCLSFVVITLRRSSNIYFIRSGASGAKHSVGFTLLTFLLGWWGIPWGPIYSIGALYTNFSGGKDVTSEVLRAINQAATPSYDKAPL